MSDAEDTLTIVATLLRTVMDGDLDDEEVTRETSFQDDLELESIEFVALAEQVNARWGEAVDFDGWLAAQGLDQILALTVGDLVDHIDAQLGR